MGACEGPGAHHRRRGCRGAHVTTVSLLCRLAAVAALTAALAQPATGTASLCGPGSSGRGGDDSDHSDSGRDGSDSLARVAVPVATNAVCLDGSQFAFFDSEPTGAGSSAATPPDCLVVFFQGGGLCADDADCVETLESRELPNLRSPTRRGRDILSSGSAEFGCCRRVLVPYCSQDLFSGDGTRQTADGTTTLHFRGARIVAETFGRLNASVAAAGGLAGAYNRTVIVGASAGSVGAGLHLNALVARYWGAEGAAAGAVRLVGDSGWFVDVPTLASFGGLGLVPLLAAAVSFWNSSGPLAELCDPGLLGAGEPSACYIQGRLAPTLTAPALFLVSLGDPIYLSEQDISPSSSTDAEENFAYLGLAAGMVRQSVTEAALALRASPGSRVSVFAVQCFQHIFFYPDDEGVAFAESDYGILPASPLAAGPDGEGRFSIFGASAGSFDATPFASAFSEWLAANGSELGVAMHVDECTAGGCNPTCPFGGAALVPSFASGSDATGTVVRTVTISALVLFMIVFILLRSAMIVARLHTVRRRIMRHQDVRRRSSKVGAFLRVLPPEVQCDVHYQDISYFVGSPEKQILKRVSGVFMRNTMTAVMGRSGSGKTTLMEVLGQYRTFGSYRGNVYKASGGSLQPLVPAQDLTFVESTDIFYESLTVREVLLYRMLLTAQPDATLFDSIVGELGLHDFLDVPLSGCSSGQRRRVTTGCALLNRTPAIFFDEPTSGLDSTTALQLMTLLSSIVLSGRTFVVSIHQPRPEILFLFDSLLIVDKGEAVFNGSVKQGLLRFGLTGADDVGSKLLDAVHAFSPQERQVEVERERWDAAAARRRAQRGKAWAALATKTPDWPRQRKGLGRPAQPGQGRDASPRPAPPRRESRLRRSERTAMVLMERALRSDLTPRPLIRLVTMFLLVNGFLASVFPSFEVETVTDAFVLGVLISLVVLVNTFLLEQKLAVNLQAELHVNRRELRQHLYGNAPHLFVAMTRDLILATFVMIPASAISYFGMGLSTSTKAFLETSLAIFLNGLASAALVSLVFRFGLPHRVTVPIIQLYKMLQALFSGVIVPIEYLPGWLAWLRYASPVYHAQRTAVYVTLTSRSDFDCSDKDMLSTGALPCVAKSPGAFLGLRQYPSGGLDVVNNTFPLLFIYFCFHFVSWLILHVQTHRHMRRLPGTDSDALGPTTLGLLPTAAFDDPDEQGGGNGNGGEPPEYITVDLEANGGLDLDLDVALERRRQREAQVHSLYLVGHAASHWRAKARRTTSGTDVLPRK